MGWHMRPEAQASRRLRHPGGQGSRSWAFLWAVEVSSICACGARLGAGTEQSARELGQRGSGAEDGLRFPGSLEPGQPARGWGRSTPGGLSASEEALFFFFLRAEETLRILSKEEP